jgi:hypothetical protein
MKNTRVVVALTVRGCAALLSDANPQTSPPSGAAQTKSPKEHDRERKDEWADRPGTGFWRSVFAFFLEGFATHGASMYPTAAVSDEAVLTPAGRPRPRSASRTPIATEHGHGPYLITENGDVVEFDRAGIG